ncbi:MAG: hypothetical protein VX498_03250 [Myxococcota bacterium]|nr:hypothetical protein [Myxococcota bacterium]
MAVKSRILRCLIVVVAAVTGAIAGLFIPAMIASRIFDLNSYEEVLFWWLLTVPASSALAALGTWRMIRPPPDPGSP